MCRHCSPVYSSVWEQVVKKEPDLMAQQEHEEWRTIREKDKHVALTQETIDEVVEMSPHLTELMITGGEPLYHSKHYDFLERCLPEAHHITLQYNSNFSKLDYKGKSILDLWRKFKRVSIRKLIKNIQSDGLDINKFLLTIKNLKSMRISQKIVDKANLILTMENEQKKIILEKFSNVKNKTFRILEYGQSPTNP